MKKLKFLLAIGKATELSETTNTSGPRKRYIGYTNVNVIGVNPTKAEWEKLYGFTREDEPKYFSKTTVNDKPDVNQVRIDFIVKTVADKSNGIELTDRVSFFISNAPNFKKDGSKVQMIDKYGETAYIDVATAESGAMGRVGRFSGEEARPAYVGEDALTAFIRAYAGVNEAVKWNNDTREWLAADDRSNSDCRLDMESLFKNSSIKEIKDIPFANDVRVVFGVKKTDDGKLYSDIYSKMVLKKSARDTSFNMIFKNIEGAKAAGQYPNTEFANEPLREYAPEISSVNTPVWSETPAPTPAFGGGISKFFNKG
jgi:hypothetical protein